ncbi:hypothetical protein SERLA73DRAFT_181674 [Serpula lacrymans var. lacrymans S7.3]|uniref:Uncharacterized protein n=2 Tax=Serpula lacrymans var. lacrymans TaxID=341189 RepID=F8PYH5_SERL3|nr:uncharacterized protein SERLADRAFT_467986 [Serpula lacrymans var. lacrymans S7.9]EGN98938.1 hypothetical protein SERLA73DRAFT_181674 [Serpula lacrymans var. lacrymans S7.3]EGO24528.1 hypothetical protein SERLADRAFT_467986 [Serpula lacrymans var. lacrymans S7.9]
MDPCSLSLGPFFSGRRTPNGNTLHSMSAQGNTAGEGQKWHEIRGRLELLRV